MKRILIVTLLICAAIFNTQAQNLNRIQIDARAIEVWNEYVSNEIKKEKTDINNHSTGRGIKKKLASSISEQLDPSTATWTTSQVLFDYDLLWNNVLRTKLVFSPVTFMYENSEKWEYTFDSDGEETSKIISNWDDVNSQWVDSVKFNYSYTSQNELNERIEQRWDTTNSVWKNIEKRAYSYNAAIAITEMKMSYYIDSNSSWVPFIKFEEFYLSNGDRDYTLISILYPNTTLWVNRNQRDYFYDSNRVLTNNIDSVWQVITNIKEQRNRTSFSYNANGNTISNTRFDWNKVNLVWDSISMYIYNFDTNFLESDVIAPNDFRLSSMYLGFEGFSYWMGSNKYLSFKRTFYYSDQYVNTITELNQLNVSIHPNPVSESLNISFEDGVALFELISMDGRILISKQVDGQSSVNLENLESGTYIYQLTNENGSSRGKLIKQ